MALLDEIVSVPRRTLTLFLLIDTSACMEGNKIGAVNDAVVNVLPMLDEISQTNPDAEIKVAALEFSDKIRWMYDKPLPVSEFVWQDISAGGSSFLGNAFWELNKKLSRKSYMLEPEGSFAPMILLLSASTPEDNYNSALLELKDNKWFNLAIKVAIAIGDKADVSALKEFTGSSEAVFTVHNIEALKKTIRVVAVTYSQIGSNSNRLFNSDEEQNSFSKMKLQEALMQAVSVFGKDILIEPRLLNILNDYHGFDEMPAARVILQTMQKDGCINQIVGDEHLSRAQISSISKRLNSLFGYDVTMVEQIIDNLSSAKCSSFLNLSTNATDEDIANGVKDEFGALYSPDGKRLLKGVNTTSYSIKPGTQVICDDAFRGYDVLMALYIPDSVTHIGDRAFTFCQALISIAIPDSVIHIGIGALDDCCGLIAIRVSNSNRVYDSRENCNAIIHTASNTIVAGCSKTIIPNSVTHIGGGAFFGCSSLTKIVIPNSVTHIGYDAFFGCKALTSIVIPESVIDIGNSAFSCCSALSKIVIRSSATHIADSAFISCDNLTSIIIPKGSGKKFQELLIIGSYKLIEQGDGEGLSLSTEATREDLVNGIQDKYGAIYSRDGRRLLKGINNKSYHIQEGTRIVCNHAFSECQSLENLILPEGLTHIGDSAFSVCKSLQGLFLPKSLIHIGDNAFSWCLSLRFLVFQNKIKSIGQDAFRRCFLEKVFIPDGTRSHFESILPKEMHKTIIEGNTLTTFLRNQLQWNYIKH